MNVMLSKVLKFTKKNEIRIVSFFFSILLIAFTYSLTLNWIRSFGDSAFLSELIENIANTGHASSNLLSSSHEMEMKAHIYSMKAEQIKQTALKATDYQNEYVLKYHTYFILYLIAPLNWIIPINILLPFLTALAFTGILFVTYLFLRKNNVSVLGSFLFCFLISVHPAWNHAIQGEFYVDRFFMLIGLLLIFQINDRKPNYLLIFFINLICLISNDRIGLYTGAFSLGYSVLFFKRDNIRYSVFLFWLGIVSICYAIFAMKVLLTKVGAGGTYDSWLSVSVFTNFLDYLKEYPNAFDNFLLFSLINILILTVFGFLKWQIVIITLGSMIPNILGNIGGAEKSGWTTHYHSNYFPILIWALAISYISFFDKRKSSKKSKPLAYLFVLIFILFYLFFNPFSLKERSFDFKRIESNAFLVTWNAIISGEDHPSYKLYETAEKMRNFIPEGSSVSSINYATSFLYKNRKIYYYPLAIDEADYVVLRYDNLDVSPPYYSVWVNYDPEENIKLNKLLNIRLKEVGYDVYHPKLFDFNFAILERKNNQRNL
ncbi:MAG: DUF2079 domain-containing protein [Leptospira sp.]|nr:DUF2079 domain-containing protein [Leptospira sp.]